MSLDFVHLLWKYSPYTHGGLAFYFHDKYKKAIYLVGILDLAYPRRDHIKQDFERNLNPWKPAILKTFLGLKSSLIKKTHP